jgi:hypothetical protein
LDEVKELGRALTRVVEGPARMFSRELEEDDEDGRGSWGLLRVNPRLSLSASLFIANGDWAFLDLRMLHPGPCWLD